MGKIINGIQQIGIGVSDAKAVFNWYRKHLGFDILVFEDESTAELMTKYTDGTPQSRYALLALNMIGGGGLEIWQFRGRKPQPPKTSFQLGDLGINIMKIRSSKIQEMHGRLKGLQLPLVTSIDETNENNSPHFFFTDPWGNLVEIIDDAYCFTPSKSICGGVLGVVIGVRNMEDSVRFYQNLLGYKTVVNDRTGSFDDFHELPNGKLSFRRVLLKHPLRAVGGFGELLGPTEIELVQVLDRTPIKLYKDRLWGDLGYIHLCFDIHGMNALREEAKSMGHAFTVDSANSFDMGDAAGHFSYVEDPDGTLIEFVETHKVPILKSLGIFIDLEKRNPTKPLPKWLVKSMKIHRVRKDLN
ncbi:hypothetical protein MNBD_BACTEROID03-2279 [hydrothermal vent metagenome]|uniref:VOC domain-containing protein n=1 Tax=hydrothermal vent metagenome TaxID=652676 RepID=A0A3B0T4V6_9ZZZZ